MSTRIQKFSFAFCFHWPIRTQETQRITQTELNCNQTSPSWNITHLCSSHSHLKTKHTSGSVNRAGTRLKTPQKHSATLYFSWQRANDTHEHCDSIRKFCHEQFTYKTHRKSHFSTFNTHKTCRKERNLIKISIVPSLQWSFAEVSCFSDVSSFKKTQLISHLSPLQFHKIFQCLKLAKIKVRDLSVYTKTY